MGLTVHQKSLPKPLRNCHHYPRVRKTGQSVHVRFDEGVFVEGDVWQIYGWLQGLGLAYIEGDMTILLHENLWKINGELTVYGAETHELLRITLHLITRTLHGLTGQYPGSNYRFTATYTMKWDNV